MVDLRQSNIYEQAGATNTDIYWQNDYFFNPKKSRMKCILKCGGVTILFFGMNAISFYVGYIVSHGKDGSGFH